MELHYFKCLVKSNAVHIDQVSKRKIHAWPTGRSRLIIAARKLNNTNIICPGVLAELSKLLII